MEYQLALFKINMWHRTPVKGPTAPTSNDPINLLRAVTKGRWLLQKETACQKSRASLAYHVLM